MPEIGGVLAAETRLTAAARRALRPLVEALAHAATSTTLQEEYVLLFDRSRTPVAQPVRACPRRKPRPRRRDGRPAGDLPRRAASSRRPAELPDHLPVLLEFLATRPAGGGAGDAGRCRAYPRGAGPAAGPARKPLCRGLRGAAAALPARRPTARRWPSCWSEPDADPTDLEALDAVWEETEVTFGPDPNAGCPQVRDMLARMDSPRQPASAAAE